MFETKLILSLVPVFLSIVLHEIAHGYAALKLGDDTAQRYGRLSLNPLKHVDWFGTIFLPLTLLWSGSPFLFGWAKPVPVNFNRLKNVRRDTVIVASAGIVVNAVLAFLAVLVLAQRGLGVSAAVFGFNLLTINLALIFLNILPFPPLDGSKIFFGWIDKPWARRYIAAERQGMFVLVLLIAFVPVVERMFGLTSFEMLDPLGWYMHKMFEMVFAGIE
uniref:Peptidase M48 n=1 Tax=uncultured Alphaproteobacteria bacterium TaxID=91750 RepID=A0A6G8F3D8_9PROT|nr:peptidase M48 [uncultured Alphaproteobacteria bacterium]